MAHRTHSSNYYVCLGLRIAQVRVVFQIPSKAIPIIFLPSTTPPTHLAYVEWFSSIPVTPEANSLLYKVSRLTQNGWRKASIIPVDKILSSVHLILRFAKQNTSDWNTFTVLKLCHSFYVNPFSDHDTYLLFA